MPGLFCALWMRPTELALDEFPTGGRQDRRARGVRRRLRLRLTRLEPPGEAGVAAITRRHRRLTHAIGRAFGTDQTNMEMIVMPIPRPEAMQPRPIADRGTELALTERAFDHRIDEDAIDMRIGRGEPK